MNYDKNKLPAIAYQLDSEDFWGALEESLQESIKDQMFELTFDQEEEFKKLAIKKEMISEFSSFIRDLINKTTLGE